MTKEEIVAAIARLNAELTKLDSLSPRERAVRKANEALDSLGDSKLYDAVVEGWTAAYEAGVLLTECGDSYKGEYNSCQWCGDTNRECPPECPLVRVLAKLGET